MDSLKNRIESLIRQMFDTEGFDLVDLVIRGHASSRVLQFYVDREGGLTVGDCTYLNRKISDLLALECDELPYGSYRLEVSSPGLDRPLRTVTDFQRNRERDVSISYQSGDERVKKVGKIAEVKNDSVYLQVNGESFCIPITSIVNAKLNLKW